MAATYINTCYRILDPARSEDFYVNKLGMKRTMKVGAVIQ